MAPVNIGTRRELFVDRFLIDSMSNTHLRLARPERREVVFEANAPWEDDPAPDFSSGWQSSEIYLAYISWLEIPHYVDKHNMQNWTFNIKTRDSAGTPNESSSSAYETIDFTDFNNAYGYSY